MTHTNKVLKGIERKLKDRGSAFYKYAHETDAVEILALIGLWLKLGITGFHHSSVQENFSSTKSSSLGEAVVLNLASDFMGCGRTIVADNFFTSPRLGLQLWPRKTFLLGTIRKNREGTPKDFVEEKLEVIFGKVFF